MLNVIGFLIRYHRIKQNYSQEGLCKGICVVSYLSKIEQGQVQAGNDIIHALFHVLNVPFYDDEDMLKQGRKEMCIILENILYEEAYSEELHALKEKESIYQNSPLCITYALVQICEKCYQLESVLYELEELSLFHECMNEDQLFLYHFLYAYQDIPHEKRLMHLHTAKRYGNYSVLYQAYGHTYLEVGDYTNALHQHQQAYELACKEGNAIIMLQASLFIGNCYACIGIEELMLVQYEQTLCLCRTMKKAEMEAVILYNVGSTLLELGRYDEVEETLLKSLSRIERESKDQFLTYHKLFFLYHKQKQREKSLSCIEKMKSLSDIPVAFHQLIQFVEHYEKDELLKEEASISLLHAICDHDDEGSFYGLRKFHVPFLIQAYKNQRRYKEALEISQKWEINKIFL